MLVLRGFVSRALLMLLLAGVALPAQAASIQRPNEAIFQSAKLHPDLREKVDEGGIADLHTVLIKVRADARLDALQFRTTEVLAALKTTASQSQTPVINYLKGHGAEILNQFWLTNVIIAKVNKATLNGLLRLSEVDLVFDNFEVTAPPVTKERITTASTEITWGLEKIQAHRVWDELGYSGEGVRVAVLDTGVDLNHPDLAGRMHNDNPGDPTYPGGWMEFDANGNLVSSQPYDSGGHGTHVSGTVLGGDASGVQIGVAPGATLMHGLVLPGGGGTFAQVVAGMQWAVDPTDAYGNPAGERPHIVSMSFGANGLMDEMVEPIRNMYLAGVLPIAAIGNCGARCVGSPGAVYEAWGIGATDITDAVAEFSSGDLIRKSGWGNPPSEWPDEWIKPDISAPGVDVVSAVPGGGYEAWSGTSMATPHVSGVAALMLGANPALTPDEVLDALVDTAMFDPRYGEERPNIRYGWGRIDAFEATSQIAFNSGIVGVVTDAETGAPVDQALVRVTPSGRGARTKADGTFTLPLPAGTYAVEVERFGYETSSVGTVIVPDSGKATITAALTPLPTGTLTGTVSYGRTGAGIPGVTVRVKNVPIRVEAQTNVDGVYQLRLPTGTYDLTISTYGFSKWEATGIAVQAGDTTVYDAALEPTARVGVVGDVEGILSRYLSERGYLAEPVWFDVQHRLSEYQALVINFTGPVSEEEFTGLVDAAHETGVGIIFTSIFPDAGGIDLLNRYYGDPSFVGFNWGPDLTAEVTQAHAELLPGLAVGDRFPVFSDWADFSWFEGYSGQSLAAFYSERGDLLGTGFAYKENAQNRHVLLASLGAIWWQGPSQWSSTSRMLYDNAIRWVARPDDGGARFAVWDLQVSPQTVLWYEPVTVTVRVKNVGDQAGTMDLGLTINGMTDQAQSVTLEPNGDTQVTFIVRREPMGAYKVQVGHLSASFRVRPPQVTVSAKTITIPPSGKGKNADPGEPAIPLVGAQVDVVKGGKVISRGKLNASGELTFESTGSRESYTIVIRHTNFGYNTRRHYLLTMPVTVEDDTAFAFRPDSTDTVMLSAAMTAKNPSHKGSVFFSAPTLGSAAFEFPLGELAVTPGDYQLAYVMTYDVPGAQWAYASERIARSFTPGRHSFTFGGNLSLNMQDVVGQQAPAPQLTWGMTDSVGNQISSVFLVDAGAFGKMQTRVLTDFPAWPASIEAMARSEVKPLLTLTDPYGAIVRTGSVSWKDRPKAIPMPTEQVQLGDYRLDMQFDSGPYMGVLKKKAKLTLPARSVSRTVLLPGDTFTVAVSFDAGTGGQLSLTESLPPGFTITNESSSPKGSYADGTWTWPTQGKGAYKPGETIRVTYTVKVGTDVAGGTYNLAGAVLQNGESRMVAGPQTVQVFR